MKLKQVNFDKEEDLKNITVVMSLEEACWMAKMTGKINNVNSQLHSDIYQCLTGAFFNKFYEDGADEAMEELKVVLPKIEDIKQDIGK